MSQEMTATFWVLEYTNGQEFLGRYADMWTLTPSLSGAVLYVTKDQAERARQALIQEANDRISRGTGTQKMWWDLSGGVVQCVRVLLSKPSEEVREAAAFGRRQIMQQLTAAVKAFNEDDAKGIGELIEVISPWLLHDSD